MNYGVFLKGNDIPIAVFDNESTATRYAWEYIKNGSTSTFVVKPYFGSLNKDQH